MNEPYLRDGRSENTSQSPIQNRSSCLNRARPQSIAAGVVFFWMKNNNKNITIKEYSKKVKLSELTINKIIKEIESII